MEMQFVQDLIRDCNGLTDFFMVIPVEFPTVDVRAVQEMIS